MNVTSMNRAPSVEMNVTQAMEAIAAMLGVSCAFDFGPEIRINVQPCWGVNASLDVRPRKGPDGLTIVVEVNHSASIKSGSQARLMARILGDLADLAILVEESTAGLVWDDVKGPARKAKR